MAKIGRIGIWVFLISMFLVQLTSQAQSKKYFIITGKKHLKLITTYPVQTVDKFYTGQWVDMDSTAQACACEDNLPDDEEICCACDCDFSCLPNCRQLDMKRILPNNQLCQNEYQVSGSEIK